MFVQSKETSHYDHKDGLCIDQRRGGRETLVQWANGAQRWCPTTTLEGSIHIVKRELENEETH